MSSKQLVDKVNGKLEPVIGFKPYQLQGNAVICASCHSLFNKTETTEEFLSKTQEVQGPDGKRHKVHACPRCKYAKGVNLQLRRRITELRKKIGVHEVPSGKFKNTYFTPGTYYFQTPDSDQFLKASESELETFISKQIQGEDVPKAQPVEEEVAPVIPEVNVFDDKVTEEELAAEEAAKLNPPEEKSDTKVEEIFTGEIDDSYNTKPVEKSTKEEKEDEPEPKIVEDEGEVQEEVSEEDYQEESVEEVADIKEVVEEEEEIIEPVIDEVEIEADVNNLEIDDSYSNNAPPKKEKLVPVDSAHSYQNHGGNTFIEEMNDPSVDDMIRQNAERAASRVFQIGNVRKNQVYGLIAKTRTELLNDEFNQSSARSVVDMILQKFENAGRPIKKRIIIGEATHECPVVDFEGNVRLIFVDLDKNGGQYNVSAEINKRVRPSFAKNARFRMMTFTIYSDMIVCNDKLRRVVKGIIKHIAHNLDIPDVVVPISIFHQSERYFYTTSEFDKLHLDSFIDNNGPGNVDKPSTDVVAIVNSWTNPEATAEDLRYRQMNVLNQIARNNDIDYSSLSMYITSAMKYIAVEESNGTVLVNITDYIETLDLFIRDGFGACLGIMIHNVKNKYPGKPIKVYYELDPSMIPSPTIYRYIAEGNLVPLSPDFDVINFNKIANVVAKEYGVKNILELPVDGQNFIKPEYTKQFWRSIQKTPNFRSYMNDDKRLDWRRFAPRNFFATLGEQVRGHKINVYDPAARAEVLDKLGYRYVSQPKVDVLVVTNNLLNICYHAVCGYDGLVGCDGCFSLTRYVNESRSHVVGNNYGFNNQMAGNLIGGMGYSGYSDPNVAPWVQQPGVGFGFGQPADPMALMMNAYSQVSQ